MSEQLDLFILLSNDLSASFEMTQTYELSFKPLSSAAVHLLPNFTLAMLLPAQLVNISNNIKVDNIFMIKI